MAGVQSWNQSRDPYKQEIKRLRKSEEADEAFALAGPAALETEEPDLQPMQLAYPKQSGVAKKAVDLASSIETADGDKVAGLQHFKDQSVFFSSMRDFVADLEDGIFLYIATLPAYKLAVQAGMLPVPTASDARKRLQQLRNARSKPNHPASAQLLQSPAARLEVLWSAAVDLTGVSQQHYQLLRTMKDKSNTRFHQPPTIADARQLLELPLPQDCSQYKEPLLATLALLQRWSA